MNPIILFTKIKAALSALRPVLFAIIGGLIVSGLNRCSEQKPVNIILNNQAYESQLRNIEKKQDSILRSMPDSISAYRYLSERYDRNSKGSADR